MHKSIDAFELTREIDYFRLAMLSCLYFSDNGSSCQNCCYEMTTGSCGNVLQARQVVQYSIQVSLRVGSLWDKIGVGEGEPAHCPYCLEF